MTAKLPSTVGLIKQTGFFGHAVSPPSAVTTSLQQPADLERQPFTTASEGSL